METKIDTMTTITLILTDKEASWLKAVMQNPLHDEPIEAENIQDTEMRRKFFYALAALKDIE